MLVLSRRPGESLVIGGIVTVTIIQTNGGKIRLGIEAPKEVSVHRAEVLERIKDGSTAPPGAATQVGSTLSCITGCS